MAINELPMDPLLYVKRFMLPKINSGDPILVYNSKFSDKPHLFCSDGRLAQSDVTIGEEWVRYVDLPPEGIFPYGPRIVVDEALRRGYLKEIIRLFGREKELYEKPTSAHEHQIVNNGPVIMFGYNPKQVFDIHIYAGSVKTSVDSIYQPSNRGSNKNFLVYSINDISRIVIGEDSIADDLTPTKLKIRRHTLERR